jgi:BirA family biotin operon repressor/biotin-[acetyl-CoA-carboxylase] ligase
LSDSEVRLVLKLKSSPGFVDPGELARSAGLRPEEMGPLLADLRERGYGIEVHADRGYRLRGTPDTLDDTDLRTALRTRWLGRELLVFGRVTSTNDIAVNMARSGVPEGTAIVAEEQTRGRGRLGRSWYSPPGEGLWLSMILRPDIENRQSGTVSLVVALGIARALRDTYGIDAALKWPNDILVDGRKICGILTEAEFAGENIEFVVVGMGMNVLSKASDFPAGLRHLATSVLIETFLAHPRSRVLADVLKSVEEAYEELSARGFGALRSDLMNHSMMMGKMVRVMTATGAVEGMASEIDDSGALVLRMENGRMERVLAGDVVTVV